jgi:UDP-GlcNAc:undecaprenyl-phosphate/decaprenyl-phosphate GlcNAc-1-phosphate transferase
VGVSPVAGLSPQKGSPALGATGYCGLPVTLTYAAAFAGALMASLTVTPVMRRAALRLGMLDVPTARKTHPDPVPYLGGMAILLAFVVAVVVGGFVAGDFVGGAQGAFPQLAAILGGGLLLAGLGLWDDLRTLPVWVRLLVEVGLGVLLYQAGVRVQLFHGDLLDLLLTLGWVVGITNAVNFLDNMDGLSVGISAIAGAYFFALAALSAQVLVAGFAAALTGGALGFLWYNRPPARIFMGDAGSLFLGFLLAALGLKLRFGNIERVTFFVPVAVMAVPILDTLTVSVSRMRQRASPFRAGKDHISHRLVKVGIPPTAAVALLYWGGITCGWIGAVIAYAKPHTAYMLMGWMVAVGIFLGALLLKVETDP